MGAPQDFFRDARLKVGRGKKHISDLGAAISAFAETDFCRIIHETDRETGRTILRAEIRRKIPEQVALTIGDAAHNLRCALDLMYFELVGLVGGDRHRHTKFPFRETREELVSALAGGGLKAADRRIHAFIIDGVQPYRMGNHALYSLNDLDIADKHHLLTPVVQVAEFDLVEGRTLPGFQHVARPTSILQTSTGGGSHITVPQDGYVLPQGKPTLEVLFQSESPFGRRPVVETLTDLSFMLDGIVDEMARVYLLSTIL